MSEGLKTLETMVGAQLAREPNPTPERIRELITATRLIPMCAAVDAEEAELLARRFEERHGVLMTIGSVLVGEAYRPWLDVARANMNPYYWERYRKLLDGKGISGQVLATLDSVTDRILGLLENPAREGAWDRRGMVVGHVQSGKTANYTGLICKAADAGYRLVVVIAGVHNNLRNQTQLRMDEGFVGRDSARLLSKKDDRFVGVGRYDQTRRPVTFTNSVTDFNRAMATGVGVPLQNLNEPAVFVIKKNPTTLQNLLDWLKEHSARGGHRTVDAPMLLIDDEADNASINIKHGTHSVARINGLIRDLLQMFERSCYVGYTATPFANIFIDPDSDDEMRGQDLFPRHFIVSLDPPSNYFGANRVFFEDSETIIRHVEDGDSWLPAKHKIATVIDSLSESMLDALRTFVVGRAIRLLRGHVRAHCSMLVNASRFTNVQRQIRDEIHSALRSIQSSVRVNGALPADDALKDPVIAALQRVWQTEFNGTEFTWPEVQGRLHESAAPITVVEVNSSSSGLLNYAAHEENGLNVIAVGGFSLSRGLTLEGLMVSYFLRNSMAYDTLMQMGRWFGYRPDYEDLCRIWMLEEAEGWYAHITESIEMLREDLRIMEAAGGTPEDFGLKVRSHPDSLIVTARNKMGAGKRLVVSVGLGNNFIETATLKRNETSLKANRAAAKQLANRLTELGSPPGKAEGVNGGWLLKSVPAEPILDFISTFENHPDALLTDPAPVRRYIEARRESELANWDVLFTSIGPNADTLTDDTLGLAINCQSRTAGFKSTDTKLLITNKQRVASRGIERIGLTDEEVAVANETYRASQEDGAGTINYPDRIYRAKRRRPLLMVHLLKIDPEPGHPRYDKPVVAYGLSFPPPKTEEKKVEYVVTTTWLRQNRENFKDEVDEEDMGGDDA